MSELSQHSIDNLFDENDPKGGGAKTAPDEKYPDYDFQKPALLSKAQINTLAVIHEAFAQWSSSALTTYLQNDITIKFTDIEQHPFNEYVNSLAEGSCFAIYETPPLHGQFLLHIESGVLHGIIDKMLGGEGGESVKRKGLTEIEVTVTRQLFGLMLKELEGAWANLVPLKPVLVDVQAQLPFVRIVPMRELCVVVTMEIAYGSTKGAMTSCLPYLYLEPVLSKLDSDMGMRQQGAGLTDEVKARSEENFHEVDLELHASLGSVEMPMSNLLFLQSGDVLDLEKPVKEPIELFVEGVPKFFVSPGLTGRYKGVIVRSDVDGQEPT